MLVRRHITAMSILAMTLLASPARADTLLTPFAGLSFKGVLPDVKLSWGASLLFSDEGWAGLEIDFSHTPGFYGDGLVPNSDNSLVTLTGNLVVSLPIGGEHGPGVRPYVLGGLGLIRSRVDIAGLLDEATSNDFGISAGAGLILFFNDRFGVRGDLRYFRTFQDMDFGGGATVDGNPVDFWRATVGASIRF